MIVPPLVEDIESLPDIGWSEEEIRWFLGGGDSPAFREQGARKVYSTKVRPTKKATAKKRQLQIPAPVQPVRALYSHGAIVDLERRQREFGTAYAFSCLWLHVGWFAAGL